MSFGAAVVLSFLLFAIELAVLFQLRKHRNLLAIAVAGGAAAGFLLQHFLAESYRAALPPGTDIDIGSVLIRWIFVSLYIVAAPVTAVMLYRKSSP